ncbi:MAG: type IV secretion system DNA-binding domain-containing protein [Candidatus Magasanikbacteria bacterium]|nr:type IV secretion system DNA-binding domain-containing protein [Candidatus Magasanikbacteria bacterium]
MEPENQPEPIPEPEKLDEITYFAETNFRGQKRRFGIRVDDRRRHMYLLGKTGMGKSTLMEQMIISDIYNGNGVGLVDPHGDFVEKILDYIPNHRINDVIYFNPADQDHPIGFNVMESIDPRHKHLVASGLMGVFKKIWPDVWSPRMEYILNNCILALLDYPGSTLLGINRLLVDKEFRKRVVAQIKNPVVKTFWVDEFAHYTEKFATEAIAPIQNKVGQFLSSSIIRNVLAQVKSTINIREIMDNQKIFLINLSKGRVGEENMRLLGGMLITKIQLAAMERVDVPEQDRKDFFLFVDEFQNFATESFANILSEARKYRLSLILAHQYIEQLEEEVAAAVFGNVGTLICFRVGGEDAEFLAKEFEPEFLAEDLVNLGKYNVYLKLMINGVTSSPFSASTFVGEFQKTGNAEKVIKVSRERYTEDREVIEEKIMRWSGLLEGAGEGGGTEGGEGGEVLEPVRIQVQSPKIEKPKSQETRFEAICSRCNKDTTVPFKPDGKRPILCVDCYKLVMSSPEGITGLNKTIKKEESVVKQVKPPVETVSPPTAPPPKTISLAEAVKMTPQSTSTPNRSNRLTIRQDDVKPITPQSSANNQKIKPGQIISF